MLIEKMLKTISQHNLISNGDRIVVGLSGGADSVALLRALLSLRSAFNLTLVACHVNHKLRSGTAERDQRWVLELCSSIGVECHVKEAQVEALAKEWNISVEEAGRRIRYDFFNEIAGVNGKIATAHHMNDNVETVLMRFMRGTGLHGLTGIPYQRDNIIRPLLEVSRQEIEDYLAENNCSYVTDETNFEPVYTRNKIRLNLIPEIQREFNPNFVDSLSNNVSIYREEDDFMTQTAQEAVKKYFVLGTNMFAIDRCFYKHEHIAIVKRSIMIAAKTVLGVDLSSQAVNTIVSAFDKPRGKFFNIGDELIVLTELSSVNVGMKDEFNPKINTSEFNVDLNTNGSIQLGNITIKYERVHASDVVNNENVFYFPIVDSNETLKFRTRRDGDVVIINPLMRKKLKKFFVDKKIPSYEKDKYWLLVNEDNNILWIPKLFGSRLKESQRTGEFMKFEIL
jgi:tRNA(Ile)-lysidine synthase